MAERGKGGRSERERNGRERRGGEEGRGGRGEQGGERAWTREGKVEAVWFWVYPPLRRR